MRARSGGVRATAFAAGITVLVALSTAAAAQVTPVAAPVQAPQTGPPASPSLIRMLDEIRAALEQGRSVEAEGMLLQLSTALRRERLAADAAARGLSATPEAVVRVGGDIREPRKIRDVRPEYPQEAQTARVAGVVILEVTVGQAGDVTQARVLRSVPLLDQAALDAVYQWKYTPTLLNNEPVSVIMTVTVSFTLGEPR